MIMLRQIKETYQKIWQNLIINLEQKSKKISKIKRNSFDNVNALYKDRRLTLNAYKGGISPIQATKGEGLKILTPQQIFQTFLMAFA